MEDNKRLLCKLEDYRTETAALREHVYRLTEKDLNNTIPIQKMIEVLYKTRIIIIGGHVNWINKLKENFPHWGYIFPSPNGAIPVTIVDKADRVYFFTDVMSHAVYERYIGHLREKDISFGYIHEVNIQRNIRQVYRELIGFTLR